MDERILRAKHRGSANQPTVCDCGESFRYNETVFLYPVFDEEEHEFMPGTRIMFCMTCHFHIINDVMEAMRLDD